MHALFLQVGPHFQIEALAGVLVGVQHLDRGLAAADEQARLVVGVEAALGGPALDHDLVLEQLGPLDAHVRSLGRDGEAVFHREHIGKVAVFLSGGFVRFLVHGDDLFHLGQGGVADSVVQLVVVDDAVAVPVHGEKALPVVEAVIVPDFVFAVLADGLAVSQHPGGEEFQFSAADGADLLFFFLFLAEQSHSRASLSIIRYRCCRAQ